MKYSVIIISALLAGCTTVPVTVKFPEAPSASTTKCPPLERLEDGSKLSDISKTVTRNYSTYYECAARHDGWVEWYQVQKKLFEGLK